MEFLITPAILTLLWLAIVMFGIGILYTERKIKCEGYHVGVTLMVMASMVLAYRVTLLQGWVT